MQIDTPVAYESFHIEKSFLTLDFFGTPKLVLKKSNAFSHEHTQKLRVTYKFNQTYMLMKPLGLSLTVFAFYLAAIVSNRITLSFNEEKTKAKSD